MASSLTSTAYYARRAIKYFAIGVVIYLILYIGWIISEPLRHREPPPLPIVPMFGGLPLPEFPEPDPNVVFSYRLETPSGGLPINFPDRTVVYQNRESRVGFFSLTNAVTLAKRYQFLEDAIPISPPIYHWKKVSGLPGLLEINTVTQDIDLIYNWRLDPNLLISQKKTTNESVYNIARSELTKGGFWNKDIQNGDHKLIYFKIFHDQLLRVSSISEAELIQVNFRKAPINKLPIVHADPERPPIWVLVSRSGQAVEFHYRYYITGTQTSEYPILPVELAWQQLIQGKAYIAQIGSNIPGQEIVIRDFSLAYYITNHYQPYTQAVYVIKGDNDFTAYVPAVNRTGTAK